MHLLWKYRKNNVSCLCQADSCSDMDSPVVVNKKRLAALQTVRFSSLTGC